MKVLQINCNYMGTKLHQTMIEHLEKYVEDCVVYCPIYNGSMVVTKPRSNVVCSKCFNMFDRVLYFNKQRKIYSDITKKVDVCNFNIIHSHTLFTDGYVAYRLNKSYGIPYVVAIRDTDINTFLKYKKYLKFLAKRILNNAKYIVFLSNSYKNQLINLLYSGKCYPYDGKTRIIPNGIDDFWLDNIYVNRKYSVIDNDIKIIYVGRINGRKNVITTQHALACLRDKGYNVKFTIAGKIEDRKIFDRIMQFPNTDYVGEKGKEELKELYRKNDLFVMPSHTETFGLVYAEAMSQGLPVIYTKGQGFDSQFNEGIVGYHVDDKDYVDVADKIIDISKNYNQISKNCIDKVNKFNWDKIVKEYVDLYNK